MNENDRRTISANPLIVLREEFDDWAVLFDPDTGHTFGLNPIGVLIWKHLDGHHTLDDLVKKIREAVEDVPPAVTDHLRDFVQNAVRLQLARYEVH